jgi:hypothetical protein
MLAPGPSLDQEAACLKAGWDLHFQGHSWVMDVARHLLIAARSESKWC